MIRFCESKPFCEENSVLQEKHLSFDQNIWDEGGRYFSKYKNIEVLPVLDYAGQVACCAWQDQEANREIRMLRELEKQSDAIGFQDIYPDYTGVTIHGCNELAWYMREYLIKRGITVNVDGMFWKELGIEESKGNVSSNRNYEIWAEGVHQKSGDWKQERIRSASVEFECVDKIYEANIREGRICDCSMNLDQFLEKLRQEEQIIICGTGTMAQDAYDWLLSNGIDICAFQSGKTQMGRKKLFGKPIMRKEEVARQFDHAVILECSAKNSAWGFGDVDDYAYEGYRRNLSYFLLRDYIEVPEQNLVHILNRKKLILTGDIRLCNRVYRWCVRHKIGTCSIVYWNALRENAEDVGKFLVPVQDRIGAAEDSVVMLILPQYGYDGYLTDEAKGKRNAYIEKFVELQVDDWSEYWSDTLKCIHLETENERFGKRELRPKGIMLGAIPGYSGNILMRQSLSGHPQIMLIEDYNVLNNELYYICIRLAEEKASEILADFWTLYHREMDVKSPAFFDKAKFNRKMEQLLAAAAHFTSQELFVMFHLAYEAMYGREFSALENVIIYYEPHMWGRTYVREWAYWLNSREVKNFTLNLVRNRYAQIGSCMRLKKDRIEWRDGMGGFIHALNCQKRELSGNCDERTIRFEDLKCKPREKLTELCNWLGISFDESLMETTSHGKKAFYDGKITGFDTAPAYNLYEEYFSVFDRMRICLINRSYQKENGYPYVNCSDFSRRELQEMFLKAVRLELSMTDVKGKTEANIWQLQKRINRFLWREHFIENTEYI